MGLSRPLVWIAALIVLNSCSNVSVSDQTRNGASFYRYRTYRYAPSHVPHGASGSLTSNDQLVRDAISRKLDRNRIEPAPSGRPPQFLIRYSLTLRPQGSNAAPGLDYPRTSRQADPFSRLIQPRTSRFIHNEVNIRMEFIDRRTGRVFWSGEGTEVANENAVTPVAVNRIVDKILARYPVIQEAQAGPGKH